MLTLSKHLLGDRVQYKHSQIYLELGEAHSGLGKKDKGRELLLRGKTQLEQQFGSDHAMYQKHYAFQSLQESLEGNHDSLRKIGEANLSLLQKCHEVRDGSGK